MDKGLYWRLKKYNFKKEQVFILDYIPIQIQLDLDIKAQLSSKSYIIKKLKVDSFFNTVKQQL